MRKLWLTLTFLQLTCVAFIFAQSPLNAGKSKAMLKKDMPTLADTLTHAFDKNVVLATFSMGVDDAYRNTSSLPTNFLKTTSTGLNPVFGQLELGVSKHFGIGATFGYDNFINHYSQLFNSSDSLVKFKRDVSDKISIQRWGLNVTYHVNQAFKIKQLDVYMGAGLLLNRIKHSNLPQGDSTITSVQHSVSPSIRVGARYYVQGRSSIFLDAGFNDQSSVSVGYCCRFIAKPKGKKKK